MGISLYEKYGGFAVVNRIVMALYDALLDSDELGDYFEDVDMKRQIDHQTKFIAYLLGGPASYSNEHLQRAHARLDITHPHFEEMKAILARTLADHGIEAPDVAALMAEVEARRHVIVAG